MDIGGFLREARTHRGLTLHQIAHETKVPVPVLDHLEQNQFDRLPGAIFVKGYLRAYATAVGADGERLVREYSLQAELPPAVIASVPRADARERWLPTDTQVLLAGVAILALAAFAWVWRGSGPTAPRETASASVAVPPAVATSGSITSAAASAPAATPTQTFGWPAQMDIVVTGNCWVSATVDGQSAVYRLVKSGERVSVTINDNVLLRVGDPTVFTFTLNGIPGRPVGKPGAPATVRITRESYRDFIEAPGDASSSGIR